MKKTLIKLFCVGFVVIMPIIYVHKKTQFFASWLAGFPVDDTHIEKPCQCE